MRVAAKPLFWLMLVLSVSIAGYALLTYSLRPLGANLHPEMQVAFQSNWLAIYAHIFGSALAMGLGPFQFWGWLRRSRPRIHRWFGRIYLTAGVLIGGAGGLYMAFYSFGGVVAHMGFACLAIAWLYSGWRAYAAIRSGNVSEHQAWMLRNFAMTFAAVTLRIYLGLGAVSGVPFEVTYPTVAWLSWVPNLLLVELLFVKRIKAAMV